MKRLTCLLAMSMLVACGGGKNDAGTTGGTGSSTGSQNTTGNTSAGGTSASGSTGAAVKAPPVINSFTAAPTALGAQGGDVTLTWDVQGADTLAVYPGVGDVTGLTQYTVPHLTATTTFRLVATNHDGTAASTAQVTVAAPTAISGTVVDLNGMPLSDMRVYISGQTPVFTDGAGHFTVPAVSAPYTVTLSDAVGRIVEIFDGVTSSAPTLAYLTASTSTSSSGTAVVSGAMSGTDPDPSSDVRLSYLSRQGNSGSNYYPPPGALSYNMAVDVPDGGASGSVVGLQYENLADGGMTYLTFAKHDSVLLQPNSTINGVDLAFAPAGNATAIVNSSLPVPDGGVFSVNASVVFADQTVLSLPFTATSRSSTAGVPVPNLSGTTLSYSGGVQFGDCATLALASGSASAPTTLDLGVPPTPISPFVDATNVTEATEFAWADDAHPDRGYILVLGADSSQQQFVVVTLSSSFRFPDLSPIGLQLERNTSYSMQTVELAPVTGVEGVLTTLAAVESTAVLPNERIAQCSGVGFVTAP